MAQCSPDSFKKSTQSLVYSVLRIHNKNADSIIISLALGYTPLYASKTRLQASTSLVTPFSIAVDLASPHGASLRLGLNFLVGKYLFNNLAVSVGNPAILSAVSPCNI